MSYLGIDVHKRESHVIVVNEDGETIDEVRVTNANLDEIAERYREAKLQSKRPAITSQSMTPWTSISM